MRSRLLAPEGWCRMSLRPISFRRVVQGEVQVYYVQGGDERQHLGLQLQRCGTD